eukprot:TRINITY_DN11191_c2_g1_i1.p1 TRINITY_DN11191_c2_g1~~TRINITY_DN11191_c2_g1_i1.p1  ORF type:complete len:518 (+),score=14.80 TRINITY_DN11191_c2_g1_i1:289-1842(+)
MPSAYTREFVAIDSEPSNASHSTSPSPTPISVPRCPPKVKGFSIDSMNANARNEDRSVIDVSYPDVHLFAVLDGHGGPTCSIFCEKTVTSIFKTARNAHPHPIPYESVLKTTLNELDKEYIKEHAKEYATCGSCAIVCLITSEEVITGCVGDSRAVLARKSQNSNRIEARELSTDQDCGNKLECDEVRRRTTDPMPIKTTQSGPRRVAGSLMVTRALGDAYLKIPEFSFPPYRLHVPYITSEPIVTKHSIHDDDKTLIIASDGLYNMLDNQKIVEIASRRHHNPATVLIESAVEQAAAVMGVSVRMIKQMPAGKNRRSVHDDITVVVVHIGENQVLKMHDGPILSDTTKREREACTPPPLLKPDFYNQEESFGEREASVVLLDGTPPTPVTPLSIPDDDASSQHSVGSASKGSSSGFGSFLRSMKRRSVKPSPPPRRPVGVPVVGEDSENEKTEQKSGERCPSSASSLPSTPLARTPPQPTLKRPASVFPSTPLVKKPRSLLTFKHPPKRPSVNQTQ